MMEVRHLARSEPVFTSARSRSPVERWVNPYLAMIFSHCVPLPEPGPPRIHTIGFFEESTGAWKKL